LAGKVYRTGKCLEERLDNMMRLTPVEQFQVQVAPRFIDEPLKELSGESKPKTGRHVLILLTHGKEAMRLVVHSTPNQVRPPAKINDAPGQAFIHGHIRLACKRIPRVESGSIPADALFFAKSPQIGLAEGNPAVFNRVMGVDMQVTFTA
jgi:hypothetical protein